MDHEARDKMAGIAKALNNRLRNEIHKRLLFTLQVYENISQFADLRFDSHLCVWHDFKVQHGNADPFREIRRIESSIFASYNQFHCVLPPYLMETVQLKRENAGKVYFKRSACITTLTNDGDLVVWGGVRPKNSILVSLWNKGSSATTFTTDYTLQCSPAGSNSSRSLPNVASPSTPTPDKRAVGTLFRLHHLLAIIQWLHLLSSLSVAILFSTLWTRCFSTPGELIGPQRAQHLCRDSNSQPTPPQDQETTTINRNEEEEKDQTETSSEEEGEQLGPDSDENADEEHDRSIAKNRPKRVTSRPSRWADYITN